MQTPAVSIIVPVYNTSRYLDRCVNSLVNQTKTDLEVILVDDGSTDGSAELCDKWSAADNRVKTVHVTNGGVSRARNLGIEMAEAPYISFVDSDDWMDLDAYDRLVSSAAESGADVMICDYREVYDDGTYPKQSFEVGEDSKESLFNLLSFGPRGGNIFNYILIRKQLFEDPAVRFPVGLKGGEDLWFATHVYAAASKAGCVRSPLYNYYLSNMSSATHAERCVPAADDYNYIRDCIDFLRQKGYGERFMEPLYWRVLLGKTAWAVQSETFDLCRTVIPEANGYLANCPHLSGSMKMLMKFIFKKQYIAARLLCSLYEIKNRKK